MRDMGTNVFKIHCSLGNMILYYRRKALQQERKASIRTEKPKGCYTALPLVASMAGKE